MKTIKAYEFDDLTDEQKKNVLRREVAEIVNDDINDLNQELSDGEITEKEYFSALGCSKEYAEQTEWFVTSCYYDKNRGWVDERAEENVVDNLYNKWGFQISVADDDIMEDKA